MDEDKITDMSDEWIAEALRRNPCKLLVNSAGEPTGNVRTCPVRLGFPELFNGKKVERVKNGQTKTITQRSAVLHFPVGADLSVLEEEAMRVLNEKWPALKGKGLHKPFRDGGEKPHLMGYQDGSIFITATTENRIPVVNAKLAPVVEEDKVYAGVWAICTLRAYWFEGKDPATGQIVKKGASFGLQSVMIIADDIQWRGGQSNFAEDFAGVDINPAVNVADLMS